MRVLLAAMPRINWVDFGIDASVRVGRASGMARRKPLQKKSQVRETHGKSSGWGGARFRNPQKRAMSHAEVQQQGNDRNDGSDGVRLIRLTTSGRRAGKEEGGFDAAR